MLSCCPITEKRRVVHGSKDILKTGFYRQLMVNSGLDSSLSFMFWINGWMFGKIWVDTWMDGWMDRWMDG